MPAPSSAVPGAAANGHGGPVTESSEALLARFRTKVEAGSSSYLEVSDWDGVVAHLAERGQVVAVAPSLARSMPALPGWLEEAGLNVVIPDGDDPAAEVADVPLALVRGELAIAETGSVLVSEHELGDRVVTMLCHRLVQVVHADHIEDRLEAAAAWLAERGGQPGFASLMTGPSRTADIERSLTIGVQGPDEVDVIVLTDGVDATVPPATGPPAHGGEDRP
jgi:L-lactate dehydrogenase complex protein LldG